jgi:hypothetical protein
MTPFFFFPVHVEAGKKKILNLFSRYSPSLSPLTCPKNLHNPYPHNHTLQPLWKKHETGTHALHLNRYNDPLPRHSINIREDYKTRRGQKF